jgi:hypothetical protein
MGRQLSIEEPSPQGQRLQKHGENHPTSGLWEEKTQATQKRLKLLDFRFKF